ncbi:hypothetical protein [Streptosporangium sp. NPDC006007]|uniref:hypothetical protein n=1 Tax=Streptosporangium sp. NPDC006007 TaxID=3154575 RepID=UPI0033BA8DF9
MTGTPAPEHESRHDRLPSPAGPPAQESREQVPAPDRPPPASPSQDAYRGVFWSTAGSWPTPPSAPGHRSPPSEEQPAPRSTPEGRSAGRATEEQPIARDAPGGTQDVPERHPEAPQPRPAADAQWMLGRRRTFPDEQVWPPPRPADEPPGASTQPFPAVPAAPPPGPPRASGPVSNAGVSAPGAPVPAAPPPRRRTTLRAGGAILAVALAVGIPTWQGYSLYRGGVPDHRIHTVAAGGTGTLMNVSWRVRVEQADNLPGKPPIKPDQRWLRITVTRTSLNAEGVIRRGEPGIEVQHPDGRTWRAEIDEDGLPPEGEDHRIGIGYDYEATSLVPRAVAGQVEVRIRPSTFRIPPREEPAVDLFDRVGTEKVEPGDQVLLFRR